MAITLEQRAKINEALKLNKRQYEIAKDLGITRSAVQHYAKKMRIFNSEKDADKYFNVDIYSKSVQTI